MKTLNILILLLLVSIKLTSQDRFNEPNNENSRFIINEISLGNGFLLIEEITQHWEPILVDWIDSYMDSYTYDGNNSLVEYLKQFSTNNGSTWENNAKFSYTYDGNNNQIESLEQYWNNST
jgi:hypothetical protein